MKKISDLAVFTAAFLYLIPVLLTSNIHLSLIILAASFINLLLLNRLKYKLLPYFLLIIILPVISVFITTLIYAKPASTSLIMLSIGKLHITKSVLNTAMFLSVRTFTLSFISFSYLIGIQYDKLVLSMMQNLKLPVSVGYSLLSTFNAFYHMKSEFIRIKQAYMMRFKKKKPSLLLLFPMIVSAARYAYYAGLSLESRGLNKDKTYIIQIKITKRDFIFLAVNLMIIVLITLIFILEKKFIIKLM